MTRIVLILVALSFIMSCRSDQQQAKDGAEITSNPEIAAAEISIAGQWVNETYYKSIQTDQSPHRAQKTCEFCFFNIPSSTKETAEAVINFHETMDYILVKKNNESYQLWEVENNQPEEMFDSIIIISVDKIKIGNDFFIRTQSIDEDGQYKILEQLLFKGTYLSEKGATIEFKNNGEVIGLGEYKYYTPLTDYNDAGLNIDQLKLGQSKDNLKSFAFKYKKNKLQIFSLVCKTKDNYGTCQEVEFGDLLYTLKLTK